MSTDKIYLIFALVSACTGCFPLAFIFGFAAIWAWNLDQ